MPRPKKAPEDRMVTIQGDVPPVYKEHLDMIVEYSHNEKTISKIVREAVKEYLIKRKFITE